MESERVPVNKAIVLEVDSCLRVAESLSIIKD